MRAEHQNIIDVIQSGKKIVTASRRQARFIQDLWQQYTLRFQNQNFAKTQKNNNQSLSWEQADCIAWDEWLQQNFEICTLSLSLQHKTVPKLLTAVEQSWIWQQLLSKVLKDNIQLENKPLNQQQTLLNSLLQAWTLFNGWQLGSSSVAMNAFNFSEETALFNKLIKKFNQDCENNNWLSKELLIDFIGKNFSLWKPQIKATICFYGFDDWTPQQQKFLNEISELETVNFSQLDEHPVTASFNESLHPCASKHAEWQQAASWARQKSEADPDAKIAVVIPSLTIDRAEILRMFQQSFQPQLQLEAEAVVPSGFNISVGEAINQQAIINSARRWFSLINGGTGELWKQALTDEFCLGANKERWVRSSTAVNLGLTNNTFYSVEVLQRILSREDIIPLKHWASILQVLNNTGEQSKTNKTPAEWSLLLEQLLDDLGWPGANTLTSQTFQAKHQWLEKLRQLSAMDQLCGQQSLAAFLNLLDEQMNNSKFQPETPAARVQVLGVLEAIGLSFDYLWLSGCQDNVFPAPLNASPWLPVSIQQQLHMPGACSQREQQFAASLFSGMKKYCNQIHYSYALNEGDAELKPSAFVNHLDEGCIAEKAAEQLPSYWHKQLQDADSSISVWRDNQGLKLVSGKVKSGVGILKNQASCPFKAYAEYRLCAGSPREPTIGIDPIQRGNWVHDVLEMVWLRLGTQQALMALAKDELVSFVENCATEIILNPSKGYSQQQANVDSPLIQLELQRTILLVLSWLEIDRSRADFFKVEVEQNQQISIATLDFVVRADRIDDIGDGNKIIIDYKTGKTSNASWFNERITEPQLPLYGLLFSDDLSAIAVAELTTAGCSFKGCGEQELKIKGIKTIEDWPALVQQWKINLETVAVEFSQGFAAVDPAPNACTYCEYAHLCRRDAYFSSETNVEKSAEKSRSIS